MADRSITVRIGANVAGLQAGLRTAATSVKNFDSKLMQSATNNQQAWGDLGRGMTIAGAAITAGFGLAVKSAADWESAWTGVTKTVEGTPAQLSAVEDGLRGLAKTLPASHSEIAAVAEAAGQLGISTDSVVGFTKTMIDLGETTNLSAEEAATSLARFANIMGTSQSEIDNVGSAIVGLGNNFASTESEITQMGLRIAGAGQQAGMTEGDVLGLATALSSVGIEAEAGGSAISQTMTKIGSAVDSQSSSLETFAEVAGMSASEFSKAWRQDAGGAMTAFVNGLGDTERLGRSTNQVLSELGITGLREADALRRLSASQGLLNDAMATGNQEYQKNTALQAEAEKRYQTTAAQVQIAGNAIKDAAIDVGDAFLPAVSGIAGVVGDIASAFGKLPGPVKTATGGIAGIAGSLLLVGGGVTTAISKFAEFRTSLKTLNISTKTAGIIAGAAGAAISVAAIGLSVWAQNAAEAQANTEAYKATLDDMGGTTEATMDRITTALSAPVADTFYERWATGSKSAMDYAKQLGLATEDLIGYITGEGEAQARVNAVYQDAISGREGNAAAAEWLKTALDEEANALTDAEKAQLLKAEADEAAADGQEQMAGATDEATGAIEEQVSALETQIGLLQELSNASAGLAGAQIGYEQSLDDATKSLKENGKNLDITTEKGRQNKQALLDVATAGLEVASGMQEAGASSAEVAAQVKTAREDFVQLAQKMGLSKREARQLADQLGLIPEGVEIDVDANTVPAREAGESAADYITRLKGVIDIAGNDVPAREKGESSKAYISRLQAAITIDGNDNAARGKGESTKDYISRLKAIMTIDGQDVPARKEGESAKAYISRLRAVMGVDADGNPARREGESAKAYISRLKGIIEADGNAAPARREGESAADYIDRLEGTVTVNADTSQAQSGIATVAGLLAGLKDKSVTVTTYNRNVFSTTGKPAGSKGTPGYGVFKASGGPIRGPGGPTSDDVPIMASNNEHMWTAREVQAVGGHGEMHRLRAAALAGDLPEYASGGAVRSAEKAVKSATKRRNAAQSALRKARRSKVTGKGKARERSQDRKAKRVDAAQKVYEKRQQTLRDQRDRLSRLREERRETKVDLRRGNLRESATSGLSGAYSVADEMSALARSGDLTGKQSNRLKKRAYNAEKSMRKLYKSADGIAKKLEKATNKMAELQQISDSVADTITGGFKLGEVTSPWTGGAATSGKEYLSSAKSYAAKTKAFASKLKRLQKAGFSGVILQEVAAMGVEEGTVAADALLQLNPKDTKALNQAYKDMSKYADQAGQYVSAGFYKGGLAAAEGLVSGLKKDQKKIEKQINNMATSMIKALKKALGIKSPSKEFAQIGLQTGEGMVVGLKASAGDVARASEDLAHIPSAVIPAAYANPPKPANSRVVAVVDKGAMADAMNGAHMTLLVGGKQMDAVVQTTVDRNLNQVAATLGGGRR